MGKEQRLPDIVHLEQRRFIIPSRTSPDPHLVDLDECGGFGECSCEDYIRRRRPDHLRGKQSQQCYHIKTAIEYEKNQ
jgi:hypothetical protein